IRKCNDREQAAYPQRLKKLDAHVVQPHEYDEAPKLSGEELAKATRKAGVKRRHAHRAKA
ncbi:MAG: hypothetical protein WAM77_04750, partial [Xanthobacteraceae bacterium]